MALIRRALVLSAALLAAGCISIDKILEGEQPPDARLSVGVEPTGLVLPRGTTRTITATVTIIGTYQADVSITVEGAPSGMTVTIGTPTVAAQVTTAPIMIAVAATSSVGNSQITIRGKAPKLVDATRNLIVQVVDPPNLALTVPSGPITVIRGGRAPLAIGVQRTSVTDPVAVTLTGASGISLLLPSNAPTADNIVAQVQADGNVAPGAYPLTLHASSSEVTDRTVALTVQVTSDPTQVVALSDLAMPQAEQRTSSLTVNRVSSSLAILLEATGVPSGATLTIDPVVYDPVTPTTGTARITVGAGPAAVGLYPITIVAHSAGAPDATTRFTLDVRLASVGASLTTSNIGLFPGGVASTGISITRSSFQGAVTFEAVGLPAGVTAQFTPARIFSDAATVTFNAAASTTAGDYSPSIRVVPEGLPSTAVKTLGIVLNVRAVPAGSGNVYLDWSTCTAPTWVAGQNGSGTWSQLTGTLGVYRFDVTETTGALAYVMDGTNLTTRYATRDELVAGPIDMCADLPGLKSVSGTATHRFAGEISNYMMGGGTGSSSFAAPNFTINGVRDGVHDLVVWGSTTSIGPRGMVVRDLDVPNGGSVPNAIDLSSGEAFVPQQAVATISGSANGESLRLSTSYLTRVACTVNPLQTIVVGTTGTMSGVPPVAQRSTDFHLLTVTATSTTGTRSVDLTQQTLVATQLTLPPTIGTPVMTKFTPGYTRLTTTLAGVSTAYNGSITLRYGAGIRTMTSVVSFGYRGLSSAVGIPDLSGAPGWQGTYAIGPNETGTWSLTFEGLSSGPAYACVEGRRAIKNIRVGVF